MLSALDIYFVAGSAYAAWYGVDQLRGGNNSKVMKRLQSTQRGLPVAAPVQALRFFAAVGILLAIPLWPWYLVIDLRARNRSNRVDKSLFTHPKLIKICDKLTGKEVDYERVFTQYGLGVLVTAVNAIDVDALKPAPTLSADGPSCLTRAELVAAAVGCIQRGTYLAMNSRADAKRAETLKAELNEKFGGFVECGEALGTLIIGHVVGRVTASYLRNAREWYAGNLLPEFSNPGHVSAVFDFIATRPNRETV